jgi:hypothetical protein
MSSSKGRARPLFLLAALALVASAAGAQATPTPAPLSAPPPPPAKAKGLIWGGATLFVLPYLASAIAATTGYADAAGTESARGVLWVPVVGPFIMMGNTGSGAADVLLIFDGLAQLGGLTMFVYGLTAPSKGPRTDTASRVEISIAPLVSRGVSGAMFTGSF